MKIEKGDGLVLWNGERVIAASGVGTDSTGEVIVSVDCGGGICVPVGVSGIVEIWRDGERVMQQMALFEGMEDKGGQDG